MAGCAVDSCSDGGTLRRGLCQRHYTRMRRHGSVASPSPRRPISAVMRRVRVTDVHWWWLGPVDKHGRPRLRFNGRDVRADRYVYRLFHDDLDGVLRNVCGEPACVCPEPEHRRPA